jgi:hypothetical protein
MNAKTLLFLKRITLAVILCGMPALIAVGQTPISDAAALRAIADNLSGSYILTADIVLTEDWTPVGTDAAPFTGTIDGNGKVIKGLTYSNSSVNGVGFIGVARGATITKLGIVDAQLEGRQDVGGIVGRANNPVTLSECYVSGVIKGFDHVAGIVGGSRAGDGATANITNCYSTAAVISSSYQAAGIIGTPVDAVVTNTYFAGSIKNNRTNTGGIAALLDGGASTITNNVAIAVFIRGGQTTNRILGNIDGKDVTLDNNYAWDGTEVYRDDVLTAIDPAEDAASTNGLAKTKAELQTAALYTGDLGWSASIWKFEAGAYPVFASQTLPADLDAIYTDLQSITTSPGTQIEANAFSALGKTVTYNTSDPAIASISTTGLLTINAPGNVTITLSTPADAYSNAVSITRTFQVVDVNANITTASQLNAIRYKLDGEYTLQNDITLTEDWTPVANFTGKLNGNGHIIYGLHFENQETNSVGLFSSTQGAEITQLGIEDANLLGNADVGAIVGDARGTTITESYVANSSIAGRDHVGSIVGAMRTHNGNNTLIENCYASAKIYSRQYQAGGLAGIIAGGDLLNSYFSGIVNCPGRAIGLVSLVDSDDPSSIENSFNAAAYLLGGTTKRIVDGVRTSTALANNYTLGNTRLGIDMTNAGIAQNPNNDAAGDQGATITDDNLARTSNWYKTTLQWDFDNVWKTLVEGEIYPVLKWQTTPIRTAILNTPEPDYLVWGDEESFYRLDKIIESHGIALDFSVNSDTYVDFIEDDLIVYPTENTITEEGSATFTVSVKNAQLKTLLNLLNPEFNINVFMGDRVDEIRTVDEFLAIGNKMVGNYKLMNNIDLQGVSFSGFGSASAPFTGTLDGDGYAVLNLNITATGNKQGLFNTTSGATIRNLGVVDVNISGLNSQDIGGLIGNSSSTTIEGCYVTGNINGHDHAGAFVGGDNGGTRIRNSYANATVTTNAYQVGGLIGTLNGGVIIENTYFAGEVIAPTDGWTNNAGGIVSLLEKNDDDCDITGTVSIGNVTGGTTGRFLARANNHTPEGATESVAMKLRTFDKNLYYNNAVISDSDPGAYEKLTDGRPLPEETMARSLTQLKQQATYVAIGWDFTNVWTIDEGNAFPVLKNQKTITGIQETKKPETGYTVYTTGETAIIKGIATTALVSVFNSNGQLISKSTETGDAVLPLPAKGFYIVRIVENNRSHSIKIVNK